MKNPGIIKRLAVVLYDGLLLAGIILVAYALLFAILQLTPSGFPESLPGKIIKVSYLVAISFTYYAWFWTHGGQTLGMKVWHLYLVDQHGKFVSWQRAVVRYVAAIFSWCAVALALYWGGVDRWYLTLGLGFTWILASNSKLAWHDHLSGSRIIFRASAKGGSD